ncbi:hypothetical protein OPS25_15345 [Alteromonas ponticola]|uniref:Prokaryotic glutathione synthetase ATP-binding domain-containing protein n=1 Tax=Alteromonas aquimaris TaxID=2998417 RepID=A0ABT3PAT4_9ALTE|nr:hypothetical protein [Alteromonas aquimaris]MCW8109881.1 hypothetical protein [Alteromonas aquimaris]
MKKLAFLSTDNLDDFFVYDELLVAPFAKAGWQVDTISWHRRNINWNEYTAVIVRSTWDYQQHPEEFLSTLSEIDQSCARLENPLRLQQWNMHKTYLKDLQAQGLTIVPTLWLTKFNEHQVAAQFNEYDTDCLVLKPVLSANADDTFKLTVEELIAKSNELAEVFADRKIMVQPYVKTIVEEGEYSLFYFNGSYSHAILKRPASGDFRVQEEHGGQLLPYQPDDYMCQVAEQALNAMPDSSLYARVDLIRYQDKWAVMELELIEPSLYFTLDTQSPQRFVEAFLQRIER